MKIKQTGDELREELRAVVRGERLAPPRPAEPRNPGLATSAVLEGLADHDLGEQVRLKQLEDLRAARKVLAIDAASTAGGHGWIHPRFQFDDSGQPFAEIALVLEAFGDADPIAVCYWLAEPNPILDGRPPIYFWLTDRARVVHAAQRRVLLPDASQPDE